MVFYLFLFFVFEKFTEELQKQNLRKKKLEILECNKVVLGQATLSRSHDLNSSPCYISVFFSFFSIAKNVGTYFHIKLQALISLYFVIRQKSLIGMFGVAKLFLKSLHSILSCINFTIFVDKSFQKC